MHGAGTCESRGVTMTRVLVTGFEAFAGATSNPSGDLARLVARHSATYEELGIDVRGVVLPVTFAGATAALERAVAEHSPDIVIALGLAEGRDAITPERVAINLDDACITDNDGVQPIDAPIEADGPAARFTGLPVKSMVAAIRQAGVPASVSLTAGSFVCNHVAYVLGGIAERHPGMRAGFVHVPATPDLVPAGASTPTMTLDELERGIRVAVITAATTTHDARAAEGSIH